jgi:hypothetical protein
MGIVYILIATVEETLEMLGAALALHALLTYVPLALPEVAWRIRVRTTQPS